MEVFKNQKKERRIRRRKENKKKKRRNLALYIYIYQKYVEGPSIGFHKWELFFFTLTPYA